MKSTVSQTFTGNGSTAAFIACDAYLAGDRRAPERKLVVFLRGGVGSVTPMRSPDNGVTVPFVPISADGFGNPVSWPLNGGNGISLDVGEKVPGMYWRLDVAWTSGTINVDVVE